MSKVTLVIEQADSFDRGRVFVSALGQIKNVFIGCAHLRNKRIKFLTNSFFFSL